jgi:hypothetical protein
MVRTRAGRQKENKLRPGAAIPQGHGLGVGDSMGRVGGRGIHGKLSACPEHTAFKVGTCTYTCTSGTRVYTGQTGVRYTYIHMYHSGTYTYTCTHSRNIYIHMYQLTGATALQGYKCIHMFPGRGKRREKPVQKPI